MFVRHLLLGVGSLLIASVLSAQALPKPVVVVLVGPPASGKSTQAEYLTRKFKLPVVSIEELLVKKMGAAAGDKDLERGNPELNGVLKEHLKSIGIGQGFTLDGYPATREQADYLGQLVDEMELPDPIVIQIHIPDEEAHTRSRSRGGEDDKPGIISKRLAEYHKEMDMLRAFYPETDIWTIDGTRTPDGVSATIRLLIEDRLE